MILSRKNNFLFIKGVKVAGTSVEMALSQYCGDDCIVTPITPIDEIERIKNGRGCQNYSDLKKQEEEYLYKLSKIGNSRIKNISPHIFRFFLKRIKPPAQNYYNHMPLVSVLEKQEIPETMQIVCIERCPYRKIISWANMKLSMKSYKSGGKMKSDQNDLREFLKKAIQTPDFKTVKNIDLYKNANGKIAITRVLKYENLKEDLDLFVNSFVQQSDIQIPHAKKGLMSNDLPLDFYFSKDNLKVINDEFHDEFEFFGYEKF